jgi:hypothetical protein
LALTSFLEVKKMSYLLEQIEEIKQEDSIKAKLFALTLGLSTYFFFGFILLLALFFSLDILNIQTINNIDLLVFLLGSFLIGFSILEVALFLSRGNST